MERIKLIAPYTANRQSHGIAFDSAATTGNFLFDIAAGGFETL
jgi:hypothetical protein